MQAYCFECLTKRDKNAQSITLKNGKPAIQGICPLRGIKVFRIGKS
jgi:hypothetical protein